MAVRDGRASWSIGLEAEAENAKAKRDVRQSKYPEQY
jgi:hypothetical protein